MIIDFDNKFRIYLKDWMKENADKFSSPDDMESEALQIYSKWLNTPAEWLNGVCPGDYFTQFKNPDDLVDMLVGYLNTKVGVPDLLLDAISELGESAQNALGNLFKLKYNINDDDKEEARMLAINLLAEIDDTCLYDDYIDLLLKKSTNEEVANLIIERLKYSGFDVRERILNGLKNVCDEEIEVRCMDVLVNFTGDERIYQLLVKMFNQYTNTSLLAAYLGKYGDDRAVSILEEALDWQGINYLDYIEIRNAIEELGNDVDHIRTFEGDSYYESLKNID